MVADADLATMLQGLTAEQLFAEGLRLFNDEEFFACHEVLEALWNRQSEPDKTFTQGIIQIAVGLYHARRNNLVGARKLLPRGLNRVRQFLPDYNTIELEPFTVDVEAWINALGLPADDTAISGTQSALPVLPAVLPKLHLPS